MLKEETVSSNAFSLARPIRSVEDCSLRASISCVNRTTLLAVIISSIFFSIPAFAKRKEMDWPQPTPQEFIPFRFQKAKALLREMKTDEAIEVLNEVQGQKPGHLGAALELAGAYMTKKMRRKALEILMAQVRQQRGEARATVLRRIDITSRMFFTGETFDAYQSGKKALTQAQFAESTSFLEQALESEPDNAEAMIRNIQALVYKKQYEAALEQIEKLKKINPFLGEPALWEGRSLYRVGRVNLALRQLARANRALSGSELAPVWFSDALLAAGNRKKARDVLESDVKKNPLHLKSLVALARLEFPEDGKHQESLWKSRKALQLALSRFDQYAEMRKTDLSYFESDLGLSLETPEDIKTQIGKLLGEIETRLKDSEQS